MNRGESKENRVFVSKRNLLGQLGGERRFASFRFMARGVYAYGGPRSPKIDSERHRQGIDLRA